MLKALLVQVLTGNRLSKQTWGYFPHKPRTEKEEHTNAIFCPCGRKSMCSKHYFPSLETEKWASLKQFSICH